MEDLEAGKPDPVHKKIVKTVADETDEFYVFIDTENEIYFAIFEPEFPYPENFNKIHSRIRRLEILVLTNLSKSEQEKYNYLLADNLGTALEAKTIDSSWEDLNAIEHEINLIVNTNQKKYFTYGTNASLVLIIIMILKMHTCKEYFVGYVGESGFKIIFCSLFGGIGALVFNYSKTRKYVSNRAIGRYFHLLEGALRVLYGVVYALIAIIGIRSGLVLDFINDIESNSILAFIGIVAGASDTFVAALLKAIETKDNDNPKN